MSFVTQSASFVLDPGQRREQDTVGEQQGCEPGAEQVERVIAPISHIRRRRRTAAAAAATTTPEDVFSVDPGSAAAVQVIPAAEAEHQQGRGLQGGRGGRGGKNTRFCKYNIAESGKNKFFFKGWLEEEEAFCHPGRRRRRRRRRVHECLQTQEEAAQSECMT